MLAVAVAEWGVCCLVPEGAPRNSPQLRPWVSGRPSLGKLCTNVRPNPAWVTSALEGPASEGTVGTAGAPTPQPRGRLRAGPLRRATTRIWSGLRVGTGTAPKEVSADQRPPGAPGHWEFPFGASRSGNSPRPPGQVRETPADRTPEGRSCRRRLPTSPPPRPPPRGNAPQPYLRGPDQHAREGGVPPRAPAARSGSGFGPGWGGGGGSASGRGTRRPGPCARRRPVPTCARGRPRRAPSPARRGHSRAALPRARPPALTVPSEGR